MDKYEDYVVIWSEQKWALTKLHEHAKGTDVISVSCSIPAAQSIIPDAQTLLMQRSLISTLRRGEFLDDLCQRLEQAREVGSATVDCKELLDFIRGGIK